jgi:hypothetical protein
VLGRSRTLPDSDAAFRALHGGFFVLANYPVSTPRKTDSEFKMQLSEFWENRGVKNG